jgi:hypothetical protein
MKKKKEKISKKLKEKFLELILIQSMKNMLFFQLFQCVVMVKYFPNN